MCVCVCLVCVCVCVFVCVCVCVCVCVWGGGHTPGQNFISPDTPPYNSSMFVFPKMDYWLSSFKWFAFHDQKCYMDMIINRWQNIGIFVSLLSAPFKYSI